MHSIGRCGIHDAASQQRDQNRSSYADSRLTNRFTNPMNKRIPEASKVTIPSQPALAFGGRFSQMPNNVKKNCAKTFCWCDKTVLATLLVAAMALIFVGCQSSAPGRGLLHQKIHPESDVSANAEQARLRIRVLVEPFCDRVASTADQIMASTTNQTIRREALLWKIQAVPIMRETLFHANPYIALGDTWVFLTQMDSYFRVDPADRPWVIQPQLQLRPAHRWRNNLPRSPHRSLTPAMLPMCAHSYKNGLRTIP